MTAEKALEASILHWEENLRLAQTGQVACCRIDGDDCALCAMFRANEEAGEPCGGCPVRQNTGVPECTGTPWWCVLLTLKEGDLADTIDAMRDEVSFLKSLRKSYDR